MATIKTLYVALNLDNSSFISGMRDAQREANQFNRMIRPATKALGDVGSAAQTAGAAMTASLTVPLTAIAVLSSKAAMEFESSFAGVRKTVNATEREFSELSEQFRTMATQVPVSVNELNRIGEAAGQLGIKKENIVAFTATMADLARTTNLTSDEAATATAQIQNIFGTAGAEVDRFGSTLVALGNAGASTEKDIVEMAQRIAGTGKLIGLTQDQVLSFSSALASVGINAEAGGSSISRVFLKMNDAVADGGKNLAEWARVAGMSADEFKVKFQTDAAGAAVAFISGLNRLKAAGENVNDVIEGTVGKSITIKDTLLRASGAGQLLADTLKLGSEAWQQNTALTEEANKRYQTLESRIQIFKNTVGDIAITIGQVLNRAFAQLLNVFHPVIDVVARLANWFAGLPQPIQTVTIAIAAVAAAIGPAVLAFGFIATAVAAAVPVFVSAGAALVGLGAPVLSAVAAIGILVGAFVTVSAGIAAFIASNETLRTTVIEVWNQIYASAIEVWQALSEVFAEAAKEALAVWEVIGPTVKGMFSILIDVIAGMFKNLGTLISASLKVVAGVLQAFTGAMTGDWTKFSSGIQKIWAALWDAIKKLVGAPLQDIANKVNSFTTGVSNYFKGMYEAVVGHSYVPDMIDGIRDAFGMLDEAMVNPTRRATNGVLSSFRNMFDTVLGFVRDWKGSLKGLFENFLGGLDLKGILKGDFSSIGGSLKDILGIGGGGGGQGGGILGGILGGGGGGTGGAGGAAGGIAMAANPWLGVAGAAIGGLTSLVGAVAGRKAHDAANDIVKSQNSFVNETLKGILEDASLSPTNQLKMVRNVWEVMQANIRQFSAGSENNSIAASGALGTLSPLVSKIEAGLIAKGADDGTGAGAGSTTTINNTWNVTVQGDDPSMIEKVFREEILPLFNAAMSNNTQGVGETTTRTVVKMAPALLSN